MLIWFLLALIPMAAVAAAWAALTWWRARTMLAAPAPEVGHELLLDALEPILPAALYERIATSAIDGLGAQRAVIFGTKDPLVPERWHHLFPRVGEPALDRLAGASLAAVADRREVIGRRRHRADHGPLVDAGRLLDDQGLDVLVPLSHGGWSLVAGLALTAARTAATAVAVERWRIRTAAAVRAQALRNGDREHLNLAKESAAARVLEANAMASSIESRDDRVEWAARFYGSGSTPYFLGSYVPAPAITLVVFGSAVAVGMAASLLNVAIKSCCDAVVEQLGAAISVPRLTAHLSAFVRRARDPVGVHCHVLLLDRVAGRVELASAGNSMLLRTWSASAGPTTELHSCRGQPLGGVLDGAWQVRSCRLAPDDRVVVWSETNAHADGPQATSVALREDVGADGLVEDAVRSGIEAGAVVAAVARR